MIGSKNTKWQDLLYKALFNSVIGLPISLMLNIIIVPPLADYLHQQPIIGSLILVIPFFVASTMRQFLIDLFFFRYNIIIDPKYYIEKMINRNT